VVLGERLGYAFEDRQAAAFLAGIADVCGERGHGLTILPITGSPDDLDLLRVTGVDGYVVWTTVEDDPVLEAVRASGLPAVVHGGPAVPGLGLVSIDNRAAAAAVAALTWRGARRPAVVSFPTSRDRVTRVVHGPDEAAVLFPVTRERLQGAHQALDQLAAEHPAGSASSAGAGPWAWADLPVGVCARNDAAEAQAVTEQLLALPQPPDAVVAMSDELAAGVLTALRDAGLDVPGTVAVSGWDDSDTARRLGLTTVAQSLRAQGLACAHYVLDGRRGLPEPDWQLVRRGSTR
jgi:DNA-binding LacI/PurR family transcriptional regulator